MRSTPPTTRVLSPVASRVRDLAFACFAARSNQRRFGILPATKARRSTTMRFAARAQHDQHVSRTSVWNESTSVLHCSQRVFSLPSWMQVGRGDETRFEWQADIVEEPRKPPRMTRARAVAKVPSIQRSGGGGIEATNSLARCLLGRT